VILFGTRPFVDLARIELSAAGLSELRMSVFGPALGDRTEDVVLARAAEMAVEIEELLRRPAGD
jgi:hypothetical protein